MASSSWTAPESCLDHHRGLIERHVNSQPVGWLQEPTEGEVFGSRKEAEARLQVYSLTQGFDVVNKGGGSAARPGAVYKCVHHGLMTKNTRQLEERVTRDSEGQITSSRKRESTAVRQTDCGWYVRVSYVSVNRQNNEIKEWRLTKMMLTHYGHELIDNPLAAYLAHRKRLLEYQQLVVKATAHRQAKVVYSNSRRILETEDFHLHLTSKEFYNTVRKQKVDWSDDRSIIGLVTELQENSWICEVRTELNEDDKGKIINRRLIQVWFTHPKLMTIARRFVSDFSLVIDGTFSTNRLRMPLLVAVSQLNSGKTFPIAFSWCPEEDTASYSYFWQCLKDHCFMKPFRTQNAPPRVIIGDQNKGLTASIPLAFPDAQQQFCDWHAVQAMEKKMRDLGTPWDDIRRTYKEKCWVYIKSYTEEALEVNRAALGAAVGPLFMRYLQETWVPKEKKVVYCYTRKYANLGSSSSQRSESYHDTVTELTNAQLSLEDSVKRLMMKIDSVIKDIDEDEASSTVSYSRLAQTPPFRLLRMKVSKYAVKRLEYEWAELDKQITGGFDVIQPENGCDCEVLLRFGIACRHHLKHAYLEDIPIPKTMVHPRWWLSGPEITQQNWAPFYPSVKPETGVDTHPTPAPVGAQLAQLRGLMNEQERYHFDLESYRVERQIANYQDLAISSLLRNAQRAVQMQQVPILQPNPSRESNYLVRRDPHGRANERALLTTEIQDRRRRQERSRQLQQERQQETQATEELMDQILDYTTHGPQPFYEDEDVIEITRRQEPVSIPGSPQGSQTMSLPIRTPERPRPRRSPSPEASPILIEAPASTAPAALGRTKRRRMHTNRFTEGRQQGFIPESQERQ